MSLALLTRGYICPVQGGEPGPLPPFGPGPKLVAADDMTPTLDGTIKTPPTITCPLAKPK